MSFREVRSMLRMINIHMDDGYAYELFKVPVPAPVPAVPHGCPPRWLLPCLPPRRELPNAPQPKATHRHQRPGPLRWELVMSCPLPTALRVPKV